VTFLLLVAAATAKKKPESYQQFRAFFAGNEKTLLWVSQRTLVTKESSRRGPPSPEILDEFVQVAFDFPIWKETFCVNYLAEGEQPSLQELRDTLDFVLALQDSDMKDFDVGDLCNGLAIMDCPISDHRLFRLLQIANTRFWRIRFSQNQSRILATSANAQIVFRMCELDSSFAQACMEERGPTDISFLFNIPIPSQELAQLTRSRHLQRLSLDHINLSLESAQVLANAGLENISLGHYVRCHPPLSTAKFITQIVREQVGPTGLEFKYISRIWGRNNWQSFCRALRDGNRRLKRLMIHNGMNLYWREHSQLCFFDSVKHNHGLEEIWLTTGCLPDNNKFCAFIMKLLWAVASHPTLLRLKFDTRIAGLQHRRLGSALKDFCQQVAKALGGNHQIEDIKITFRDMASKEVLFDERQYWDKLVTPILECNIYRKLLAAMINEADDETRPGLLSTALASVRNHKYQFGLPQRRPFFAE